MATEIIGLVEIVESQASKATTHNQSLREIEGRLVRVKSRTTTAQPGSPANGDTYILPASATGTNWATFTAKQLVHYYGGSWKAWTPIEGVRVYVNDEDVVWEYNGTDWVLDTKQPMLSKSVAGSSNITLTEIESRYPAIDMTGAITANINLIVTTTPKLIVVKNSSTGAFTITVKTSAGTGIVVAQGTRSLLYCDGTNVVSIAGAVDQTITAGGTTGAQTIHKLAGTVNFAAAATALVVTNNLVTTASTIHCVLRTNDATARIANVVPAAGSFTINLSAAATAETSCGFLVVN